MCQKPWRSYIIFSIVSGAPNRPSPYNYSGSGWPIPPKHVKYVHRAPQTTLQTREIRTPRIPDPTIIVVDPERPNTSRTNKTQSFTRTMKNSDGLPSSNHLSMQMLPEHGSRSPVIDISGSFARRGANEYLYRQR